MISLSILVLLDNQTSDLLYTLFRKSNVESDQNSSYIVLQDLLFMNNNCFVQFCTSVATHGLYPSIIIYVLCGGGDPGV
jgi:hypothetical protein